MFKTKKPSNTRRRRNQWLNKKSAFLLTTAALAASIGFPDATKAEITCPTYSNRNLVDPKISSYLPTMTVQWLLLYYGPRTCDTSILTIAHRGVHSFGMDTNSDHTTSISNDHSSRVSVTPVGTTNRYLVDENTFMSYLIAGYRAKNGDVIPMDGVNYKVNVPWTSEADAPNAIEMDVQRDKAGSWVAIHDSTLEREVGPAYAGLRASQASLVGVMRVYHPADFTYGKAAVIKWDPSKNKHYRPLYSVATSELATLAQIRGGSKIFIQYHVRSIDDLKDFHYYLLERIYNWKKFAPIWDKHLYERAVQQFYYYMHIYDVQRFYTNGNFTDANCGSTRADAKSLDALKCISVIEFWVKQVEAQFLANNPGAVAGIDTPKKVGLMSGMFADTHADPYIMSTVNLHRAVPSHRVQFMGLDISNNTGEQYPAYIETWSKLMRRHEYNISHTMNHPSHYQSFPQSDGTRKLKWGFLRSGAAMYYDAPTWSRHATHGIAGYPHGSYTYKPTMLVSDRPYLDRKGIEGNGWNWEFNVD